MKTDTTTYLARTGARRPRERGYTIIEVLVASGVLMLGALAAVSLALTMAKQDSYSNRAALALNWHENAADLYRMGLDASTIGNVMPPNSVVTSHTITTATETVANLGDVTVATSTIVFKPDSAATTPRSHVLKILRPADQ